MRCISQKWIFRTLCLITLALCILYATMPSPLHIQNILNMAITSSIKTPIVQINRTADEFKEALTSSMKTPFVQINRSAADFEKVLTSSMKTPFVQINRTADEFEEVLRPSWCEYLSPVNSFRDFMIKSTSNHSRRNRLAADVFRSGYGLIPFVTEDGKKGWMENGVVYRPIRQELKQMSSHSNLKINHPTDFEHYVPYDKHVFFSGRTIPSEEQLSKPKIILWSKPIGYFPRYNDLQPLRLCPDFPCRITSNGRFAEKSSALVFDRVHVRNQVPKRRPDQVFIFHDIETPPDLESKDLASISLRIWRSVFNWTMSTRMDSDIQTFYGIIRKRPDPLVKDYKSLIAMKTKLVATTISHCNTKSRREEYVWTLKKYIEVDVYGNCGPFKCRRGSDTECGQEISSQYKFYLGFENALCDGYVTEKLFRYMSLDVILVVRGGINYLLHLPPEIFINAADYKSPQHLAERLKYLDQHPGEYEAMLREKDKYMALYEAWYHVNSKGDVTFTHYHYEAVPFCRICHRLWNLDSYTKTIPDIKAWFYNYTCTEPRTFS